MAGAVAGGRLAELALVFGRLGLVGVGGPAAHIAMMRDEIVRRRGWMDDSEFLDLVGAASLLPGPNSTELAIHVGRERAGAPGLLVAGICFILPAALLVTACAWIYVRHGTVPAVTGVLRGMTPVVLGVIAVAVVRFARTAVRYGALALVAIGAAALSFGGVSELPVLVAAGAAAVAAGEGRGADARAVPLAELFLVFLKIGAVLYGSGYVLLAFLRTDVVGRGWLTESQLLDAVAVGQATPGPLFTAATFVGYLVAGPAGAAAATLGIFLPAFLFVAASGPLLALVRRSPRARRFLDGVNAGAVGLMGAVLVRLGDAGLRSVPAALLAAGAAAAHAAGVPAIWLVGAGAIVGLLLA